MDSDIFWDKYREDIKGWANDRIHHESILLKRDLDNGLIDEDGFDRSMDMLKEELYNRIVSSSPNEAYDRAMKGI